MNFYTVALFLLLGQLLKQQGKTTNIASGSSPLDLLGEDVKNVVSAVNNLANGGDKTDALFALASNPTVMQFVGKLLGQKCENNSNSVQKNCETVSQNDSKDVAVDAPLTNGEGYVFKEVPSKSSRDFFRPVEKIADEEVKHKLYWFYDNWYLK